MSLPAWECGLKHNYDKEQRKDYKVTPRVGVWIETRISSLMQETMSVTPRVGVWIETLA